jgi:hypothetical protein
MKIIVSMASQIIVITLVLFLPIRRLRLISTAFSKSVVGVDGKRAVVLFDISIV